MLLLALVAFVFGLLASLAFSAAPFVAGNVLAVIAVVGLGFIIHWSIGFLIANLVVCAVMLQAGFFVGTVSKIRSNRQGTSLPKKDDSKDRVRTGDSTMDRTR